MLNLFWGKYNTGRIFLPFSFEHLMGVVMIFLAISTLFIFKDFYKKKDIKARYIVAGAMAMQQALLYLWYITSGSFTFGESLPLYTCRIAIIVSVFMMIKPKQWMVDIAYFWGLAGGLIALITPDTSTFAFPHFMFIQYFWGHGLLLFSIFYMLGIKECTINVESLRRIIKISMWYVVIIIPFNKISGGNYSYLSGKPLTPTILDALPPYPFYIPIILMFMSAVFVLAYIPHWIYNKKTSGRYEDLDMETQVMD